jgi:ferrochelatase
VREVVVHPIGFVCDHVEVLYDVDVLFSQYAADRGVKLFRPESLNDSPTFIAALADIARALL